MDNDVADFVRNALRTGYRDQALTAAGVAPALVIYSFAMQGLGKLGWIAAFIYCAGAALRLARFNTRLEVQDKRWFQGLPSPAAAALIAGLVWVAYDNKVAGIDVDWLAWVVTVFAGLSMVSNLPFYSGKDINLRKSVPFMAIVLVALAFTLVSVDPPIVLFALFLSYGVSGYVLGIQRWRRRARRGQDPAAGHGA
jgi:CDP-diacylglycerol--serine O-phosphatidyltransferase